MENRKLYTACQGKNPLRPLRAIAGAIEERRQNRRESEDKRMSLFKKSGEGFLAKLFKHKQVEELAEELAHTYADEMQADMLSDNPETDTAEGESPPQETEPSEVRKHLITFRVNDMELEAINRRYAETSFKSRGDFCRYSALTVMNVEEDTEDIKLIARYISSISNSFNQVAHRINKGGKLYDEDISDMKARLEEVWQLLVSIRSTRERTTQLLISATQTKPQTANMLLATCAYLLHVEHQNSLETSGSQSAQGEAEVNAST